jgi:hypothetical protein
LRLRRASRRTARCYRTRPRNGAKNTSPGLAYKEINLCDLIISASSALKKLKHNSHAQPAVNPGLNRPTLSEKIIGTAINFRFFPRRMR